jgi:DNA-binding helix-hairpin-helix protein with protein kinase domain
MTLFIKLFIGAMVVVGIPLAVLATINALRKKQPGCSGSHDCVVYKGEKVQCPSCELREYQATRLQTNRDA